MTQALPAPITTADHYFISHGNGGKPYLGFIGPGVQVFPGVGATVETEPDLAAAMGRYVELGGDLTTASLYYPEGQFYNPITKALTALPAEVPDWTSEGSYPLHGLVMHNGKRWLHISDKQGEPDEVYDLAAGSGDWLPI